MDGNRLMTSTCEENNMNQLFKFNPTGHNQGSIESLSNGKCLSSQGGSFTWRICSDASRSTSYEMIWTCYCPLTEKGGYWQDRDWVGLKLKHADVSFFLII